MRPDAFGDRRWRPGLDVFPPPARTVRHPLQLPEQDTTDPSPLGFALFILVNGVLFIRPMELVQFLVELPVYEITILICLICSLTAILKKFQPSTWVEQPVTMCVLGLLPAIMLSHLVHVKVGNAFVEGREFAKVVVYYVLMVSLLTSYARIRWFCLALVIYVVIVSGLALMQFYGVVDIPSLTTHMQVYVDPVTGDTVVVRRLISTGIFNDPNDLCMILIVAMAFSSYWLTDRAVGTARFIFLVPLLICGFTLAQTQSRGGFLALMAGMLVLLYAYFGVWKTIPLAAVLVGVMLFVFAGRQTNIDIADPEDTARLRIGLWQEGLVLFKEAPLFGIGKGEYEEEVHKVPHNSFIHAFSELGIVGGSLFTGVFFLSFWSLNRLKGKIAANVPPHVLRMRPFLLAAVVAYAVGILSLSRAYIAPTYMVCGLAACFLAVPELRSVPRLRLNLKLIAIVLAVSVATLGVHYGWVKAFAR